VLEALQANKKQTDCYLNIHQMREREERMRREGRREREREREAETKSRATSIESPSRNMYHRKLHGVEEQRDRTTAKQHPREKRLRRVGPHLCLRVLSLVLISFLLFRVQARSMPSQARPQRRVVRAAGLYQVIVFYLCRDICHIVTLSYGKHKNHLFLFKGDS